jgi:DNA-binding NtrC family response regulator
MATVLCSGGESLYTRHLVLQSAGFDVVTASTRDALLTASGLADVEAVILDSRSNISDLPAVATDLKRLHPRLPVVLVNDAGSENVPQPAVVFDRVMSRLDGPAALLRTLRELTAGVVSISEATTCSAGMTYARTQQVRRSAGELKDRVSRLRQKLVEMRTRRSK